MPPKMTILSYGNFTWDDFIAAYNSNTIVYCRASSNSNPASGNQTRMAFMAYVNSTPPTEVEFQYYRSVSSHSATQQGDQVYIYKLNKTSGWSVTVREAMSKIAAGTGLASTYKSGTITLSTQTASTASLGAVKIDGTSININDGTISATGIFSGKVTAGSTATNPMDLVTLSQLEAALPSSLPYFHTTLTTPASTFALAHYLDTTNIQVSITAMEAGSTYTVPNSNFTTGDLVYMVKVVDQDNIEINFSKELNGSYDVNILGLDTTMYTDGNYLLIS